MSLGGRISCAREEIPKKSKGLPSLVNLLQRISAEKVSKIKTGRALERERETVARLRGSDRVAAEVRARRGVHVAAML